MSKASFFNGFQEVSPKAWKQKIQADLKGADYNEALLWESPEGIVVKPFYHKEDVSSAERASHKSPSEWFIGQEVYAGDAGKANTKARDILKRGGESLLFTLPDSAIEIEKLLKNIEHTGAPLYLKPLFFSGELLKKILADNRFKGFKIHILNDPIGRLASSGNWFSDKRQDFNTLEELLQLAAEHQTNPLHLIGVDMSIYQNAGANMVQQLAYGIAHANEYLNALFTQSELKPNFTFTVAVGGNYFFEIAKIRALRRLWASLLKAHGLDERSCHILAMPSRRNKTLYDYNTNLLRTTTECMSAVLGGANTLCNLPYDSLYHKDNEFGERLARNQLLILKEESYFDKVGNPADGAYYIESITDQLASKALEIFKTIEKSGGFLAQLKTHTVQRKIKESALKEQELFNEQAEVLIGTNKYQNAEDKMKDDLELHPFLKANPRKTEIAPILGKRLAEELEQKRLKDE